MDLAALEEVSDDDLRSWIEVLEERARDGHRDNEEEGYLSLKQIYQVRAGSVWIATHHLILHGL